LSRFGRKKGFVRYIKNNDIIKCANEWRFQFCSEKTETVGFYQRLSLKLSVSTKGYPLQAERAGIPL